MSDDVIIPEAVGLAEYHLALGHDVAMASLDLDIFDLDESHGDDLAFLQCGMNRERDSLTIFGNADPRERTMLVADAAGLCLYARLAGIGTEIVLSRPDEDYDARTSPDPMIRWAHDYAMELTMPRDAVHEACVGHGCTIDDLSATFNVPRISVIQRLRDLDLSDKASPVQ